jgi:hypothetical protein
VPESRDVSVLGQPVERTAATATPMIAQTRRRARFMA